MSYTELGKDMNMYNYYIGEIEFSSIKKDLINVTDYINSNVNMSIGKNGSLSSISKLNMFLPVSSTDESIAKLISRQNIVGMPFIIIKLGASSNELVFNGIIKTASYDFVKGMSPEYIRYSMTIIHKAYELERLVSRRIFNKFDLTIDKFINNLLKSDERAIKFKEKADPVDDITGYNLDINLVKDYNSIRLGDAFTARYMKTDGSFVKVRDIITTINKYSTVTVSPDLGSNLDINLINEKDSSIITEFKITVERLTSLTYVAVLSILRSGFSSYIDSAIIHKGTYGAYIEFDEINDSGVSGSIYLEDNSTTTTTISIEPREMNVEFLNETLSFPDRATTFPIEYSIGYDVDFDSTLPKVYNPSTKLKTFKNIISSISDKYYMNYNVDDFCNISIYEDTIDSNDILVLNQGNNPTSILDANDKINSFSISSDCGEVMNSLYITEYADIVPVETSTQINSIQPKENLFYKTEYEIGNNTQSTKDNDTDISYYVMGNNSSTNRVLNLETYSKNSGFIKAITLQTGRSQLEDGTLLIGRVNTDVVQVYKQTDLSADINIDTRFLKFNKLEQINILFSMYKDDNGSIFSVSKGGSPDVNGKYTYDITISGGTVTSDNDYVYVDGINGTYMLEITSIVSPTNFLAKEIIVSTSLSITTSDTIYFESIGNTDELIEWKYAYTGSTSDNLYSKNENITLNAIELLSTVSKTITYQDSYMFAYPTKVIGSSFAGIPELYYLDPDTSTTTALQIGSYVASSLDANYFYNLLNTNSLSYIEVYNEVEEEWIALKVATFDDTTGIITVYDAITLDSDFYINQDGTKDVKFRRIFTTNGIDLSKKPIDDLKYEAYAVNNRGAFGFNVSIDKIAIKYLLSTSPRHADYWQGLFYDLGSLIGLQYNTNIKSIKYLENKDSIDEFGYYEEVQGTTFINKEDFALYAQNEMLIRSTPTNKGSISLKFDQFVTITGHNEYTGDAPINKKKIVIYGDAFKDGVISFKITKETRVINNRIFSGLPRIINYSIEEVV